VGREETRLLAGGWTGDLYVAVEHQHQGTPRQEFSWQGRACRLMMGMDPEILASSPTSRAQAIRMRGSEQGGIAAAPANTVP
jgi:hypothetical protein